MDESNKLGNSTNADIERKDEFLAKEGKLKGIKIPLRQKRTVRNAVLVGVSILCAVSARLLGVLDIMPKTMGIFRSTVYIGLFAVWGLSVRERIIGTQARRYLTIASLLMILWFVVRSLKYYFVTQPVIVRYLWYLYYPAMILIPMLAALAAVSIGEKDDAPLPKKAALLYVPAALLVLLVLTNDLHQLVFRFPENAAVWSDKDYGYGIGYVVAAGWMVVCAFVLLVILCKKRRVADRRKLILLPCVPIFCLLLYLGFYVLEVKWLRTALGDMTAVFCLMYAATLELFIRCGFLRANTHYTELFHASSTAAQITDDDYRVLLSSDSAQNIAPDVLRQTEISPVMLDGGIRLSGAPIKVGHVVWTEDLSPLFGVLNELEDMKEELQETNQIEEEEQALKKHEAHILEQDRLYNILQRDTANQLRRMDEMILRVENAENEETKRRLLYQMIVIGSYLKRRSNLAFLSEKSSMLDAHELELCIGESQSALESCGIVCGYRSGISGQVLAVHIVSMYEFFEEIAECLLDTECSMTVFSGREGDKVFLKISTDADIDLSHFSSENVTVSEEDGEQILKLCIKTGGGTI